LSNIYDPVSISNLIKSISGQVYPIYYKSSKTDVYVPDLNPRGYEANVTQIVKLLIGESLYGRKDVFIRELIQNALDACERRSKFLSHNLPKVDVRVNTTKHYFEVDDNGDGMNSSLLRESFAIIGKSINTQHDIQFYNSKERRRLIGQFGIGFISSFMIAEQIRISTKFDGDEQINFDINNISESFIYHPETKVDRPADKVGTTIRVFLKDEFWEYNFIKSINDFCRHILQLSVEVDDRVVTLKDDWNVSGSLIEYYSQNEHYFDVRLAIFEDEHDIISSNAGFYICKDPKPILPNFTPRIVGGEINLYPYAIDLNISRNNILDNSKTKYIRSIISKDIKATIIKAVQKKDKKINRILFLYLLFYLEQIVLKSDTVEIFDTKEEIIELIIDVWELRYLGKKYTFREAISKLRDKGIKRIYKKDTISYFHRLKKEKELLIVDINTNKYHDYSLYKDVYFKHDNSQRAQMSIPLKEICMNKGFELYSTSNPFEEDKENLFIKRNTLSPIFLSVINEIEQENKIKLKLVSLGDAPPIFLENNRHNNFSFRDFKTNENFILNCENVFFQRINIYDPYIDISEMRYLINGLFVSLPKITKKNKKVFDGLLILKKQIVSLLPQIKHKLWSDDFEKFKNIINSKNTLVSDEEIKNLNKEICEALLYKSKKIQEFKEEFNDKKDISFVISYFENNPISFSDFERFFNDMRKDNAISYFEDNPMSFSEFERYFFNVVMRKDRRKKIFLILVLVISLMIILIVFL